MYDKKNKILNQIWERNYKDKEDSDSAFFMSLMYTGELLTKLICCGLLAGIEDDSKKYRYTQIYNLVRADGIGKWSDSIDEILTGPTSHLLSIQLSNEQRELTSKKKEGSWHHDALTSLNKCLEIIGEDVDRIPVKASVKNWFGLFARLRNKTRGHGAMLNNKCSAICPQLENSLLLICNNFSLFNYEWAYLSQNLSGKYKVNSISSNSSSFNHLKSNDGKNKNYDEGVYIYYNRPILIELIKSDSDITDFYFPNGGFNSKKHEVLSYVTGNKELIANSKYLLPPGDLPISETEGRKTLEVIGNCFTNLPNVDTIYIERDELEEELSEILMNQRHPMVTLLGRGGIGKTSLALKVLTRLCQTDRFQTILWFSARDIDLLENGAKSVQPQILDIDDIAKEFVKLICPEELEDKKFNSRKFVEQHLQDQVNAVSPILAVFDNFETVKNPSEMFTWLDTYIRTPNKILITSRISEFKADYPITVSGMSYSQFKKLVKIVSKELNISKLINEKYIESLFEESAGHPYVAKILLGVVANDGRAGSISRIVASQDELLTALFERTYAMLSKASKKVFLTLSSWRSTIPKIGIEAVLTKTALTNINVEAAIEELYRFSFIDIYSSHKDSSKFISLPLSAFLFGQNKLEVSTFKQQVIEDREILMMFGAGKVIEVDKGIDIRIEKFFRNIARRIGSEKHEKLSFYKPILEYLCRKHHSSWLTYASLMEEFGNNKSAIESCQQFIQNERDVNKKISVWKRLSGLYKKEGDFNGETHSLVEMCEIDSTLDSTISSNVTRINFLISNGKLDSNEDEKTAIIKRMIKILNKRLENNHTNLDDRTKLAWLNLQLDRTREAKKIVEFILNKNPNHIHAKRILNKM